MPRSRDRSRSDPKPRARGADGARQQVRGRFGNRALGRLLSGLSTPRLDGNLSRMRGLLDEPGGEAEAIAQQTARRHRTDAVWEGGGSPRKRATRQPDFGPLGGTAFARSLSTGGGGRPVAPAMRAPIEQAIDTDLSDARVHDDSRAARLSRAMRARAFTVGRDIYVDRSQADINTRSGREVLRHELTHVGQNKGSPKAGPAGATIQRAHARTSQHGWDKKHECFSDIKGDGKALERPFDFGVAHVGAHSDSEFGGHAWLAFESFELMDDPTYGEWVYPETTWTDLVYDSVRMSTGEDAIARITHQIGAETHMGRTFYPVPTGNITRAVKHAKRLAGRYVGKRKKTRGDAKDALYYDKTGTAKKGINCAKYVEEVLGAAGVDASAGRFIKTPNQVASGMTMQQLSKEKKGGGRKKPFGS